ncbi:hypothetical protein C8R44DRAFT_292011 [Mycena epipterygia]|nr:hypothetical protein C8R44DRAFT_292011 [Mycena epipterygia]
MISIRIVYVFLRSVVLFLRLLAAMFPQVFGGSRRQRLQRCPTSEVYHGHGEVGLRASSAAFSGREASRRHHYQKDGGGKKSRGLPFGLFPRRQI